jgi:hypothetical protein
MNWNQFLIYLTGIYAIYYIGNLAFDLLKPRAKVGASTDSETLFFADDLVPQLVVVDEEPPPKDDLEESTPAPTYPAPQTQSTGGMRILDFIASAKPDVYEFTRAIPYG